tara:strand:- start:1307 stop:2305 length:999 start_codon:yes stop_codon:yes gene_type:complete
MAELVNRRRNIFINSEQYHQSNGDINLIFPGADFAVNKNEFMRLSLESFTMQRRFYNINSTNNTFYIRDISASTYTEVKIAMGDYSSIGTGTNPLTDAIKAAIDSVPDISAADVSANALTRKITITMNSSTGWTNHHDFVCFQNTTDTPPNNVSPSGFFNDSCEILGGKPTTDTNTVVSAFRITDISHLTFESYFPASLFTLEALHLTTNLQTHSYQTPNFSARSENSMLIPSNIFAKIPISHEIGSTKLITYVDSGSDAYSVDLQNKNLNSILLSLTDDKGRAINDFSLPDQLKDGNVSFLATLKWCAVSSPELGQPSGYPTELQMNLYNN